MSPVFTTTAHVASPATALNAADIANIFEHSWPVETARATLTTVLVTWLVTLIITRKPGSGTRATFDKYVLNGAQEPPGIQSDCNGQGNLPPILDS